MKHIFLVNSGLSSISQSQGASVRFTKPPSPIARCFGYSERKASVDLKCTLGSPCLPPTKKKTIPFLFVQLETKYSCGSFCYCLHLLWFPFFVISADCALFLKLFAGLEKEPDRTLLLTLPSSPWLLILYQEHPSSYLFDVIGSILFAASLSQSSRRLKNHEGLVSNPATFLFQMHVCSGI